MNRRFMQDINPGQGGHKRSIRDITRSDITQGEDTGRPSFAQIVQDRPAGSHHDDPEQDYGKRGSEEAIKQKGRLWIWFLAVLGVVVAGFAFSSIFGGATVTLTPMQVDIGLSGSITAYQNPADGQLGFSVVSVTDSVTKEVPATIQKTVNQKASGTITVYNAYSSTAEHLIKNTRFMTAGGKVYRTPVSVTIPGSTVKAGKTVPGSVDIQVYADAAGDSYNIDATDLTLPGLKGTAQYDKIYAHGKTAMSGGYSGSVHTIEDAAWQQAKDELHGSLKDSLFKKASAQIPDTSVTYASASTVSFTDDPNIPISATGDTVEVKVDGTLVAPIFDKAKLSTYLAKQNISSYDGAPVMVDNIGALAFSPTTTSFDPTQDTYGFSLSGTGTLVWQINTDKVKDALKGIEKGKFNDIMSGFAGVKEAKGDVRPFWVGSFPENPSRITVNIVAVQPVSPTGQ